MSQDNHHVTVSTFMKVFYALVGLTALTVVTAKFMDFGSFNVLVAFSIAAVKGFLVMAYFMHLKYDSPMNRYIILHAGYIYTCACGEHIIKRRRE